ncbi:MAG: M48 family metallopeptidase [Alphaproteobacteria bacterium]|nr:M48 family metallopeptidase [Alphaproteobacteria bacterium]
MVNLAPAAVGATDFFTAQRANQRATTILLATLTLLAGGLGYLAGWALEANHAAPASSYAPRTIWFFSKWGFWCAIAVAAVSLGWSWISMRFGDRMVLAMTGGNEVTKEQEPQLYNIVEELAIAAGRRPPRIYVIETDALNAFATGTSEQNATIGVTRGLLNTLNREELQGVIGHEMGHVANLDTRYMTIVGVTVGLIALIADLILRGTQFGIGGRRDRDSKGGGAAMILMLILFVVALLAPLAANLVRMAVSRQREYLADATSVRFTRNPAGLISALQKIDTGANSFSGVSKATEHLFIINPIHKMTERTSALMATHPDTAARIDRLRNLGIR